MKTYKIALTRTYNVSIEAENEEMEWYTTKQRNYLNAEII